MQKKLDMRRQRRSQHEMKINPPTKEEKPPSASTASGAGSPSVAASRYAKTSSSSPSQIHKPIRTKSAPLKNGRTMTDQSGTHQQVSVVVVVFLCCVVFCFFCVVVWYFNPSCLPRIFLWIPKIVSFTIISNT